MTEYFPGEVTHLAHGHLMFVVVPIGIVAAISLFSVLSNEPKIHMMAGAFWALISMTIIDRMTPPFLILAALAVLYHIYMFRKLYLQVKARQGAPPVSVCLGSGEL